MNLKAMRNRISIELGNIENKKYFSPVEYGMWKTIVPMIVEYSMGKVIDVGCGEAGYRDCSPYYVGFDKRPYPIPDVYGGDILYPEETLPKEIFHKKAQTVLLIDVLEHLENPQLAVDNLDYLFDDKAMVNVVIVSVPFLNRIHDAPNDYYRFTGWGIRHLFNKYVQYEMENRGGLFCFLYQQPSVLIMTLLYFTPLRKLAFFINKWMIKLCWRLDELFNTDKYYPLGITAVMVRKTGTPRKF